VVAFVSYKQKPIRGDYDAIVVGSGIGGLTAAAILAKRADRRVLVLERHYTAGGMTQSFTRPGYEWDVGVHYVGEVGGAGALREPLETLTEGRLAWAPLPDVYDRVLLGDRRFDLVRGRERFVATLRDAFPAEASAIERWVELVGSCRQASAAFFAAKALPSAMSRAMGPTMREPFLEHATRTTADVLGSVTRDRTLAGVLAAQYGNYGTPPGRSSFAAHAGIVGHFLEGAWFPVGGAGAIAEALAPTIEAAGGAVYVSAEVASILVDGGAARGVRMADGRELRAPVVISDAGVASTFGRLVPEDRVPPEVAGALAALVPSIGHVCLYLGFRHTDEELGLTGTNLWIFPDENHDENVARFLADPEAPLPLVFASFPSAKDPTFRERHPGRATVDVLTIARWEWFSPWAERPWRRRGAEYEALKARFRDRMLEVLFARLPQLRGRVDVAELSTPVTMRHFGGHPRGELCGLDHTPERFRRALGPRTPIRGLFLSGQDVALLGVGGAFTGGALAAAAVAGPGVLRDVVWRPSS
jgi:all-trans-retinol 13,14-reductase